MWMIKLYNCKYDLCLSKLFINCCAACVKTLCTLLGRQYGFSHKLKPYAINRNVKFTALKKSVDSDDALLQFFDTMGENCIKLLENLRIVQAFLSFGWGYSAIDFLYVYKQSFNV